MAINPQVTTGTDWWSQNKPAGGGITGPVGGGINGGPPHPGYNAPAPNFQTSQPGFAGAGQQPQGGGDGDPNALIAQWKQTHPASNPDLPGLVQFLNSHGLNATQATHAGGQLSDDKIILNGGMWDLGSSFGAAGGSWFDAPQVDYNDPNANPNARGGSAQNLSPQDLSTGWTQQFTAPTAEEAMNSPGIQAALKMGSQAIQRSAASKGTLLTGGTLKDLTSFANDLGSQAYGDVWNRAMSERSNAQNTFFANQDRLFGRNMSLANLGHDAANQSSNLETGAGNAQAAGDVGSANAWSGAFTNIAGDLGQWALNRYGGGNTSLPPGTPFGGSY